MEGDSKIEVIEEWLTNCDTILKSLAKKLVKAQQKMKQYADKQRREVTFEKGDWVLVKLRPRRRSTATTSTYSKLAKRYYGPFQITKKIGPVAYKLDLPTTSRIHPVFHCSLLKPYRPSMVSTKIPIALLASAEDNHPIIVPLTILDTKWQSSGDDRQLLVLVQWEGLLPKDTSWESWEALKAEYNLEDKVILEGPGNVMIRSKEQQGHEVKEVDPNRNAEANKEKERRPKREINKPNYLRDFVSK